jgi:hypothetical protein
MNMDDDCYHYTLNGVYHKISTNKMKINNKLFGLLQQKDFLHQKFLLKYLNDFFEYHEIDYSIYYQTLLGQSIFNGIHLFHNFIEIIMMYRDFDEYKKELLNDGFQIDFQSKYFMVISTSIFGKPIVKAHIYFIHKNEDFYYHLSPEYVEKCKSYKELLQEKEDYHLVFLKLHEIFPLKKEKYEDFEVYIPNKKEEILNKLHLLKEYYEFEVNGNEIEKEEKETDSENISIYDYLKSLIK